MVTEKLVTTLRTLPFAAGFKPAQVEQLARLARPVQFPNNHVIFREGDECTELYVILSGLVSLEIAPPGRTFRVDTLSAGDELGWSALMMGQGRHFQARTVEAAEMLAFEGADLRTMCEQDPAFGYALMQRLLVVVADRLQRTRLQVLDMYWPDAHKAGA